MGCALSGEHGRWLARQHRGAVAAALVKADTSKLVTVSDEVFVPLAASELATVDSDVLYAACEILALTSLVASLVAASLAV